MHALDGDAIAAAGRILLGYAVVLATPGPNMLAIGAVATARGFAGTVPLCLGVARGVGALAALCLALSGALPEPGRWGDAAVRTAGVLLLLYLARGVFRGADTVNLLSTAGLTPGPDDRIAERLARRRWWPR